MKSKHEESLNERNASEVNPHKAEAKKIEGDNYTYKITSNNFKYKIKFEILQPLEMKEEEGQRLKISATQLGLINYNYSSINSFAYYKASQQGIFLLLKDFDAFMIQADRFIQNNEIDLIKDSNKITFQIFFKLLDEQKIIQFVLNLEEKSNEDKINELIEGYNTLFQEKEELKSEVDKLEKIIEEKERLLTKDELISENEKEQLTEWINERYDSDKELSYTLIYKASSSQGESAANFHRYCDSKGPTLTVIQSRRGNRFGGFTSVSWRSINGYVTDKKAFLFSLDCKEKYDVRSSGEQAIFNSEHLGPTFGDGYNICIRNGCKNDYVSSCDCPYKAYPSSDTQKLTGGQYNFVVEDYEVYKIDGL